MIPNLAKISFPLAVIALLGLTARKAQADLLVGSFGTRSVLRYDETTGTFIDVFIPPGSGGLDFSDVLTFGSDNNLYANSRGTNDVVLRYNGTTGAFIDTFVPSGSGGLKSPITVIFGPDNNLYVSSQGTNSVLRYNGTTGTFIDAFVPPGSGGLDIPIDMSFRPDGNLYVTSLGSNSVLRYNGTTGAFIDAFVPSGSGGLNQPTGLVFTPTPVPEPSYGLGILALGAWSAVSLRKNKLKNQKLAHDNSGDHSHLP